MVVYIIMERVDNDTSIVKAFTSEEKAFAELDRLVDTMTELEKAFDVHYYIDWTILEVE